MSTLPIQIRATTVSRTGMALLYAMIVTSVVLTGGLIISSILYRQQVTSFTSTHIKSAYYAAYSGVSCAVYWDEVLARIFGGSLSDGTSISTFVSRYPVSPPAPTLGCNTTAISSGTFEIRGLRSDNLVNPTLDTEPCVTIVASGVQQYLSSGYNFCIAGSLRRVRRDLIPVF